MLIFIHQNITNIIGPVVILDEMKQGFCLKLQRQYFPLYTITNPKFSYSEDDATRIGELTPLFAYNPDEERRYVVMNYQQCDDTRQPPAKRVRRIVNLVKNEPPPCPRLQRPLTFFMSKGKPDRALEDPEFVDYLRKDAEAKQAAYKVANGSFTQFYKRNFAIHMNTSEINERENLYTLSFFIC